MFNQGLANTFGNFFRNKNTREREIKSCEEYFINEIMKAITKENFKTSEIAMGTGNQLVGLKYALDRLREQYEIGKKAIQL